jgi:hypothetical protein
MAWQVRVVVVVPLSAARNRRRLCRRGDACAGQQPRRLRCTFC